MNSFDLRRTIFQAFPSIFLASWKATQARVNQKVKMEARIKAPSRNHETTKAPKPKKPAWTIAAPVDATANTPPPVMATYPEKQATGTAEADTSV